jgi:hypothetical protein
MTTASLGIEVGVGEGVATDLSQCDIVILKNGHGKSRGGSGHMNN